RKLPRRKQTFIRRAGTKTQQRKLVFLRRLRADDHPILGTLELAAGPRQGARLGKEKMMGIEARMGRRVAKLLIGAQQIVQQCRSGSPKPENDNGALFGTRS